MERHVTGVKRQIRESVVAIGDVDLLRKLAGFAVFSSVNGHAHAQTPVSIGVDRRRMQLPAPLPGERSS